MIKRDLHRHMGGSISIPTVAKLAGIDIFEATKMMSYHPDEIPSYTNFFRKFDIFHQIKWDYDKIKLSIQDVVWGIKKEEIKYCEIKFSIQKYLKPLNLSPIEMMIWIMREFDEAASQWGIKIDLVLSLTYESDRALQKKIASVIKDDRVAEYIAGIDLVGNENKFDVDFYRPIMKNWKSAGKVCMAHVGEIDNIQNVKDAIKKLKVHRICHGLACANNKEVMKMANDNGICFDIALTSNQKTGVANIDKHPVRFMLDNKCKIIIGTDDPVIFNTTLDNEYWKLMNNVKVSQNQLIEIVSNSIRYSAENLICQHG